MTLTSTTRIRGADGLRAIACLLVVGHHLTQRLNGHNYAGLLGKLHYAGMRGEVGVSLFFVLSGCLLSVPFWRALVHKQATPKMGTYVINRVARIVPAMWVNLILVSLLAIPVVNYGWNWARVLSSMFFVNIFDYRTFFPAELNGPLWSIGFEVWCYILLPLVLIPIIKFCRSVKSAFIAIVLTIISLQALNPWILHAFETDDLAKGWQYGMTGGAKLWLPYWNVGTFFSQFLVGSLVALGITWLDTKSESRRLHYDLLGIVFFISAFTVVWFRVQPGAPDKFTHQPYAAPMFAILIGLCLFFVSHSTVTYRILDNSLFRWIAKISFGIYLWHMVFIMVIASKVNNHFVFYGMNSGWHWLKLSAVVVLGAVLMASASWYLLENPILKKAHQYTRHRP